MVPLYIIPISIKRDVPDHNKNILLNEMEEDVGIQKNIFIDLYIIIILVYNIIILS